MTLRHDASRHVHRNPANVMAPHFNLARVETGSQGQPNLFGGCPQRQSASNGTTRSIESCENAITRGLNQSAAVFPDYLPRKLIMVVKQSTPCLIASCSRAARPSRWVTYLCPRDGQDQA